jgi:hypothetical protein
MAALAPAALAASKLTVRLSASKTAVSPGDSFTVAVNLSGVNAAGGVMGGDFNVSYDTSRFTYSSASFVSGAEGSMANASGGKVIVAAAAGNGVSIVNKDATLVTLSFKVKSGAAAGTAKFELSLGSDGTFINNKMEELTASLTGTSISVKEKASDNANLKSLKLGNATLKPAFDAKTTSYSCEVDYEVEKLQITALAEDTKASVSVNSPTLTAGASTKATVVVTAEDGSKKTYIIVAARAEDPNATTTEEEKSDDNSLKELKVDGAELSPAFKAEITQYSVKLPLGTTKTEITAKAKDEKAKVEIEGDSGLKMGTNLATITVTAEDGTVREYKLTITVGTGETTTTTTSAYTPVLPTEEVTEPAEEEQGGGIAWWWLIIVFVGGLACGVLLEHYVLPMLDKNRRF